MTWKQTYTGKAFDYFNPQPEQICIEDIAHSLSMICRFNGHCARFYSVAEHSLLVSKCAQADGPEHAMFGLLHDAAEAYIGDINPVLKSMPFLKSMLAIKQYGSWSDLRRMEVELLEAILPSIGLPRHATSKVKMASIRLIDRRMLATERRDIMADCDREWPDPAEPYGFSVEHEVYGGQKACEGLFIERFHELKELL